MSAFPSIIYQLANLAAGTPIAWRETDEAMIIIMEDGRKLTFKKIDPSKPRGSMSIADFKDHNGQVVPSARKVTKANKPD